MTVMYRHRDFMLYILLVFCITSMIVGLINLVSKFETTIATLPHNHGKKGPGKERERNKMCLQLHFTSALLLRNHDRKNEWIGMK